MGKWSLISLMPDSDWEDEILTRLKEEEERSRHRHLQLPALGAVCWVAGPKKGQGCESPAWRSAWKKTQLQEKTLESSMDCKEIQPVHSKGDWSWVFFGRTDVKAETPVLWPPHAKSWLIGKDSDAGRDWGQEEKGTTEDEMAEWHHRLNGHGFGWTPGVGDGQGGLECCDSWGRKESNTTERLDWTKLNHECKCTTYLNYFILLLWNSTSKRK